jgi:hypothetical protein
MNIMIKITATKFTTMRIIAKIIPKYVKNPLTNSFSTSSSDEIVSSKKHGFCQSNSPVTGFMHNYVRMYWGKKFWSGICTRAGFCDHIVSEQPLFS